MSLDAARGLLTCPHCAGLLDLSARPVGCPSGHRFDVAKQGYLNLLTAAPPANADTVEMVAARERFLGTGAYGRVAEAVAAAAVRGPMTGVVAEVGAGTGWYLAQVLDAAAEARGVALDVSVAAARRAARAHPRVASVVADTWRGLPLRTGSVDALLCVFAPRNLEEFRRVLAPSGVLVVVHPNPGHLAALRASYGLLDIDPDKPARLAAQLDGFVVESTRIAYPYAASSPQLADLVAMGPNAFHGRTVDADGATVDIDVTVLRCTPA